jgi:hypothetical protein
MKKLFQKLRLKTLNTEDENEFNEQKKDTGF